MDKDMDRDSDRDTDKNIDKDTDADMDMKVDMDTDVDIKFLYFSYISIWRYICYIAIWITCDTSRHKFRRRYKLEALLPDESYDMQT